MSVINEVKVGFPGSVVRVGPATWGQYAMWDVERAAGPNTERFNVLQRIEVPPGIELGGVLEDLAGLIGSHEALRTRLEPRAANELIQRLGGPAELKVEICDAEGDGSVAAEAERRLSGTRFGPQAALLVRAAVLMSGAVPRQVTMVLSHLAVDTKGARIVRDELAARFAARAAGRPFSGPKPARSPLEQAGWERSERGRAGCARSLRYWERQLRLAPRTMFAAEPGPGEPVRYWVGCLESPAIALASQVLALRNQTSTSVVILAATASVLTRWAGTDRFPVMLIAGNRFDPELRYAIGTVTQSVLATIDTGAPSFGQVIRKTWSAMTGAFRLGAYDAAELHALRDRISAARGVDFDLTWFFNDLRAEVMPDPAAAPHTADLTAARAASRFGWAEPRPAEHMTFAIGVTGDQSITRIQVLTDTCLIGPAEAESLVRAIEELLCAEASGEPAGWEAALPASRLADLDGPHVEGCRVDLAAVERLVGAATGADAVVVARQRDTAPELTAYVFSDRPDLTPELIHDACLRLLPGRRTAMTPHRYVLCPAAARHQTVPLGGRPVRTAGTGRPA